MRYEEPGPAPGTAPQAVNREHVHTSSARLYRDQT